MHACKKWSLAAVAAAVVTLGTPAAFAGTTPSTMSMDPTSGPAGTAVQVSSVTACPYTDGLYDVTARVGSQPDLVNGPTMGSQDVGDGGPWSIPITIPEDAVGTFTIYGQCIGNSGSQNEADGGVAAGPGDVLLSTYTPLTFTVTPPPTTTTTSTSTTTSTTSTSTTSTTTPATTTTTTPPAVKATPDFMYPGESCLITAQGFLPGTGVTITVFSDPLVIGTFAADANGSISQTWTVPSGFAAGAHTVTLTGQTVAGAVQLSVPITVGSLVQAVTTTAGPAPTAAPVAVTTTGSLPTTGSGLTQPLVFGAAAMLLGGGAALVVSRRRASSRR